MWSVSPKARKTSGDLCVQRVVGLLQTTQAQQGHVFGGFHALVQQNSQAWGHHPRLAREFVRSAVVRLQPGCLSLRIPSNEFSRESSRCSLRAPRRSGALAALPRTAVASLASVTQVTSGTCNSTGATSSIESLDAHKVRSEEATTRRRERRKDPERTKLKRAAKVQRCEEQSSVQVVAV